jgi:hypothetical protein
VVLHEGQQGKHIPGHPNFIVGRSILYGGLVAARALLEQFAGTGKWQGTSNKEIVEFGSIIGKWVDRETGDSFPTTRGTIHYSLTGAHIVPSRPEGVFHVVS